MPFEDFLKRKALESFEAAVDELKKGRLNVAAFLFEQAVQLALKNKIYEVSGEIPREHSIRILFGILYKLTGNNEYKEFVEKYKKVLIRLEEAYYRARYFPVFYTREEVEEFEKIAREVLRLLGYHQGNN